MFNQVRLNKEQWNLQRIFWREDSSELLREYWLTVVTFGLTSSAHLSVRSVIQAAREAQELYPKAAFAIEHDFYMGDCTTGESDVASATKLASQMYKILKSSGFELCQWKSNSKEFMAEMNSALTDTSMVFSGEERSSILGLKWLIGSDQFTYEVKTPIIDGMLTKGKIVSYVAQLYDPNGYISPVTITGKIIIQDIWRFSLSWDERIPLDIEKRWVEFWKEIIFLEQFRIDRWLGVLAKSAVQLHGFSDASSLAYGAVIYVRIEQVDGTSTSKLLVSKTRVAPLKTITIPRLELAAAELLSRLLVQVKASMEWQDADCFLWSDSTVVLHWIRKLPCNLKTYVANRVSSIQSNTEIRCWHYVSSQDNPADLPSRGIQPSALVNNRLWLEGPNWLKLPSSEWPERHSIEDKLSEIQSELKVFTVTSFESALNISLKHEIRRVPLLEYTNQIERAVTIVSYMYRFIDNWSAKPSFKIRARRVIKNIELPTLDERARAMSYLLRKTQEEYYNKELASLLNKTDLPDKSKLEPLKPILDSKGLIRVGGRLDRSDNTYEMNHPAIVPNGSRLAWLIIDHAHRSTKHGAVQLMMQFIRQKYWIPKLRNELRSYLHKCVTCARYNYKLEHQLMAELPADRVQVGKPFLHSGVDYAGPLEIKIINKQGDQITRSKCWVAVFLNWVCESAYKARVGQSMFFIGSVVGTLFYGLLSDKIGRLPALIFSNLSGFIGDFSTTFTATLPTFTLCRFISGLAADTNFYLMYILVLEYIKPSMRTLGLNLVVGLFYCLGLVFTPWLAVVAGNWQLYLMMTSLPILSITVFYLIIQESAQWLVTRDDLDGAIRRLKKVAKFNGKIVSDEDFNEFRKYCEKQRTKQGDKQSNLIDMFRTPRMRKHTLILFFKSMVITLCYDAVSRNVEGMGLSPFVMFSLSALAVLPSSVLLILLQDKIGRKGMASSSLLVGGIFTTAAGIGIAYQKHNHNPTLLACLTIAARFGVAISYESGSQYATELIPTCVRGQGVAAVHVAGFAASFMAPYILYLGTFFKAAPSIILGILFFFGSFVCLLLPETLNRALPKSLEEGEEFGKGERMLDFPCLSKNRKDEDKYSEHSEVDITYV